MPTAGLPGDAPVDRLFELSPEEFTGARDRLARSLRASGDRDAAAGVKQLRRPTVAAWALNQLARRHGDEVADLIEAGEALRQAQRRALSGVGAAPMRDAQQRRRTIVARLAERAATVLREQGVAPDAHAAAIRGALEAASVDDAAAAALLAARLSHPPEPVTGFDTVEGLTLVGDPADPGTTAPGPDVADPAGGSEGEDDDARQADARRADARQAEARRAQAGRAQARRAKAERATARLAAAQRTAAKSAADATARRRKADAAAQAAADADADAERLSRELAAVRDRARRTAEKARKAASRAREAAEVAEQRERERRDAQADVDALEPDAGG
jgi:flagellar biosynthesis GTPase FlhF